jgi:hypothetical protein
MPYWNEELQQWGYLYYEEVPRSEWLGISRENTMNEHSEALKDQAKAILKCAEYLKARATNAAPALANEDPRVFADIRSALRIIGHNLNALKARFGE